MNTQPVIPPTVIWVRSSATARVVTVVPLRSVAWIVADDTDGVMFVVVARYIVLAGGFSSTVMKSLCDQYVEPATWMRHHTP